MKKWQYAVLAQEINNTWTLWLQEQQGKHDELTHPVRTFSSDLEMLSYMSNGGWELTTSVQLNDQLPRLIFKRRIK